MSDEERAEYLVVPEGISFVIATILRVERGLHKELIVFVSNAQRIDLFNVILKLNYINLDITVQKFGLLLDYCDFSIFY